MKKHEEQQSLLVRILEKNSVTIILAGFSAITAIANLWTVSKLAPVTQDLAVVTSRVSAVETTTGSLVPRTEYETTIRAITDSISQWRESENQRLDRIERKIDQL